MSHAVAVSHAVMDALDSGAHIVTAQARLALWLRRRHEAMRQARGETAWPAAAIEPFDAWLEKRWQTQLLWDDPPPTLTLLSAAQEQCLWERLLARHSGPRALLDLAATARTAREAWHWLHAWRLDLAAPEWDDNADSAEFRAWAREYAQTCAQRSWLSPALLPDRLAPRGDEPPLRLAGFEEMTPQQTALFARFAAAPLAPGALPDPPEFGLGAAAATAFESPEAEWRAAARWARERVEAGAAAVAVVAPDLGPWRALAERICLEELHPGRAPWEEAPRAFEISLGPSLSEYPVVATALDLLDLAATPGGLEWATVSRLLRSPYLAGGERERASRAHTEYALRSQGRTRLTLRQLAAEAAAFRPLAAAPPSPRAAGAAVWAAEFDRLPACAGWPEGVALNSAEHQARAAWQKLLAEFASLEALETTGAPAATSAREPFGAALARLRRMAADRVFQPESAPAPVQVLGWLEAAGMNFDALWVLGLDDASAPAPPRPNPFLPWRLQLQAQLPRSSAGRERHFAQQRLERLRQAAPLAAFSYARHDAAGNPQLPSPLLPAPPPEATPMPEPPAAQAALPTILEETPDSAAPALSLPRPAGEHYAYQLFADQGACQFRAFAHARLRAAAAPESSWGLTPQQQGEMAHVALRHAWQALRDSTQLQEDDKLDAAIRAAARAAVEATPALAAWPWLGEPAELRLGELLRSWFQVERTRQAPFTILTEENTLEVELGGLPLRLRTDRVDRLTETGERVIVDYKTGTPDSAAWWNDAAEQPQLPLYAVTAAAEPALAGVAIAALSDDPAEEREPRYFARAARPGIFAQAETAPDFAATLDGWRRTLEELTREFLEGRAAVSPRRGIKTCKFCDLTPLCRIRESLPAAGGEEEGGDE